MEETINKLKIKVPVMADLAAHGKTPEYLFWVGSAGSYDDRAKKISRAFAKLLAHAGLDYAILGTEESDSGEAAKRAGAEFNFQMQAIANIEVFKMYGVKKIVTCDPHDYSILKNEYAQLGSELEVYHHSQFLDKLIAQGKLKISNQYLASKTITFHDPCYLGRGNGVFDEPRNVIRSTGAHMVELKRSKIRSFCCGAGGAQMFKEAEKGKTEVFAARTEDVLEVTPDILCTACPFCMLMLTDGIKYKEKQEQIKVLDIAELLADALQL